MKCLNCGKIINKCACCGLVSIECYDRKHADFVECEECYKKHFDPWSNKDILNERIKRLKRLSKEVDSK